MCLGLSQASAATVNKAGTHLRVTEIFHSLQGEGLNTGVPTVFVRLTGCPLRCGYCDTAYAFKGGTTMTLEAVCSAVEEYATPHVTVTGGEPLAQKGAEQLIAELCERGYLVSVETSGALDISGVDRRATLVLDIKTPGSGEAHRNRWDNLEHLKSADQAKFVICDRADYEWSRRQVAEHRLASRCEVLFSPVWKRLPPADLAEWILEDRLPVRFQLQLHKILWGEEPGR